MDEDKETIYTYTIYDIPRDTYYPLCSYYFLILDKIVTEYHGYILPTDNRWVLRVYTHHNFAHWKT